MKKQRLFLSLLSVALLAGCSSSGNKKNYADFEIPTIDQSKFANVTLPTMPTADTTSAVLRQDGKDIIDIYESSDFHGIIEKQDGKYYGLSGIYSVVEASRAQNKGTILISGGDMWQGGIESNLSKGKIMVETMRYTGYECMTLGNHEFDWGEEYLIRNAGYYKDTMPFLCGNLKRKSTGAMPSEIVKGSTIIERGGYKIGVIGTIGKIEYSIIKSALADFEFTNPTEFATSEAQRLHDEEGCDIIVWSSHDGIDSSYMNAPAYVNAVFGGHTHIAGSKTIGDVPFIQTAKYGESLAHVRFGIDPSTKALTVLTTENLTPGSYSENAAIKGVVDQYRVETDKVKAVEVGEMSGKFTAESELGNLCAKSMVDYVKANVEASMKDRVVAAFQNGKGGCRTDIEQKVVTYGKVYEALPFDNEIVYFEVEKNELANIFETNGGLNKYHTFARYSELQDGVKYIVATTDYVATSTGYLDLKEDKLTHFNGSVIRDVVAKYIANNSTVKADDYKSTATEYSKPKY